MKKLLALVLALVMSMSLVTISNAAFKDADKIDYKEAVDVMNAVGVFVGDEKGNFNAKDNLTREQAAKIIAYLELGSKAADALVGGATFTDVASTRWSAGFVGYCAQAGVVAGNGDGKFDPAGQLTALQFGKMLLVELGYDAKAAGMVGADWAINTSKLMAKAKLMDGIDGSVNQVLTREKAAQMCLNALEAPTVEYDTKGSNITVNGAEINFGASEPSYVTNTIAKEQTISSEKLTNNGGYTIELGEKLYKNLKKIGTTDDFGRPATKWTWKSESVGTYADKADLSYTKAVKASDIYKDLNLSDAIAVKDVKIYVDGDEYTGANLVAIKKGSDAKVGLSGNGVLTEVFYDDGDNSVIITMVNTYVGQISKSVAATSKKDAYVVIDTLGAGPVGGTLEFETEAKIDDDTYVLYTYAKGDADAVKSVAVAESVSGTVTKVVNNAADDDNKKLTVAGTEYKMSANSHVDGGALTNVAVKNDYVVYLDSYGYAIYVEEDEVLSTDYALLLATQNKDKFSENKAILVFADGTEKIVLTDKDYSEGKSDAIARGTIVTYKVNSDGEYKLKAVKDANSAKKGTFEANGTVTTISTGFRLTNDKARITLNTADDDYVYANSKTVFVVYDKANDDYTVYTGIKDAPTIDPSKDSSSVAYSYYCKSSNMATIIYIFATNTAIEDSKNVALYLSSKSVSDLIHDEDGDYFEYNAIVDGKITTVKVADKAGAEDKAGYYSHYTVDKDGYVSSTNDYTKLNTNKIPNDGTYYLAGKGIAKTSADYTVTLDTQSGGKNLTVTVDEKAKIFYEDKDGNIAESSYKNIALDENDLVYAIIDDYMVTNLVVCGRETIKDDGDDTTVVIKGTKSTIANTDALLKTVENGAYTFAAGTTFTGISDIRGGIENNIFFKFATKTAAQTATLVIKDSKGNDVYLESASITTAGGHFFYVQVIGEEPLANAGAGSLKTQALKTGVYSWTISVDGDVTISGEFTIA